ncbi:MAG: hypothetical protein RXR82_09270, partial [Nitrososphaeria archaeon]
FGPDLHRCLSVHREARRRYGGVPIYTDGAGERGRLRMGGRGQRSRRTFERIHNWLSAFTSTQDFIFENGDLGRPLLGWGEWMPHGWTGRARFSRSGRGWA